MKPPNRTVARPVRIVSLVLAAWIAMAMLPLTAGGQGAGTVPLPGNRLHLPSVILTPLGLHAEGIIGYTLDYGAMYHTVDEALRDTAIASRSDMNLGKVPGVEQLLATSGWLQHHEQRYGLIHDGYPQLYSHAVAISIEQYATPEGAAAAFAVLTSENTLATATDADGRQPLAPATPLGGQAVLWSHEGFTSSARVHQPGITLMVQFDGFIVSMNQAALNGDPPDQAALERAMSRQILHIAAAQVSGAAPSCLSGGTDGFCAQRLVGDEAYSSYGMYTVRNGIAMPTPLPEDAARQAEVDRNGLRDSYKLRYNVKGPQGWAAYYAFIDTYTGEAEATAAFDGIESRLNASEGLTLMSFDSGVPASGVAAATWVAKYKEYDWGLYITTSTVRIDNIIVTVRLTLTSEPAPELVHTLMQSQLACMQANDCTQPLPVPPKLIAIADMK